MPEPKRASISRLSLALLLASPACRASEPEATGPERSAGAPAAATAKHEPQAAPEPAPEKPATDTDPERAEKLADLDDMCKAVDHDYADGTLGDYYADLTPRTAWGKAQLAAGNESIQPGRLLEKAVAELSPGAKDPALEHCRKLLDYLDEVE